MSKKNIIFTDKLDGGKVRLTFETSSGKNMIYEYSGAAARAVLKGRDPAGMTGKRIEEGKKK